MTANTLSYLALNGGPRSAWWTPPSGTPDPSDNTLSHGYRVNAKTRAWHTSRQSWNPSTPGISWSPPEVAETLSKTQMNLQTLKTTQSYHHNHLHLHHFFFHRTNLHNPPPPSPMLPQNLLGLLYSNSGIKCPPLSKNSGGQPAGAGHPKCLKLLLSFKPRLINTNLQC